ncbi:hypothetical protein K1719_043032 [Acacia pycnantha]|nr:hypothetical protein K1719_043032 [Acacia pycnantha]
MDCMTAAVTATAAGGNNQSRREGSDEYMGVAIHSQVMKIKQEIEKIKHPSLQHVEIRHISVRDFSRQRSRSRSPLGLSNRAIPVDGRLKVPDNFIRKYGGNMTKPVYLKPPDGTEWEIQWTKYESGEVCALEIDYPLHRNLPQINDDDSSSIEILHEKPPLHKVASLKALLLSSSIRPCKKIRAEESERTSHQQKKQSHGNELKSIKAELNLIRLESEVSAETGSRSNFSTKKSSKSMAIKKRKEKPLTCDDKDRALQRVNTFTAKNPYFKIVMQPAYIKGWLNVPANFVKQNLKQKKEGGVLLQVSDGRTWRVKCNREVGKKHNFRIISGWSSFATDNNLQVGDVCVFELTNPIDISFQVHVFGDCTNPYD